MPSAMRRLQLVAEPLVFAPEPLIFSAESLLLALERFDVVLGVFGSFPQGIDGVGWGARRSGRLRIRHGCSGSLLYTKPFNLYSVGSRQSV